MPVGSGRWRRDGLALGLQAGRSASPFEGSATIEEVAGEPVTLTSVSIMTLPSVGPLVATHDAVNRRITFLPTKDSDLARIEREAPRGHPVCELPQCLV